jgi:hypothetical protein
MPIHNWSAFDPGLFHHFQLSWMLGIKRCLNNGLLAKEYYALLEPAWHDSQHDQPGSAATDMEFYRRKQNTVTVRHISGDRVVAVVEVISRSNKDTRHSMRSFVEKAAEFLDRGVHLLVLDLLPPGKHDPKGLHGAIWEDITDQEYLLPADKPMTLAAYESALAVRAYVEQTAVGVELPESPLYLEPGGHVDVPLETTYQAAFAAVPRRWRQVLEAPI